MGGSLELIFTGKRSDYSSSRSTGSTSGSSASFRSSGGAISASQQQAAWRQVSHWSGRGDRDTQAFVIALPTWRLNWSAKGEAPADKATLRISVYDTRFGSNEVVVDTDRLGSDTVYVRSGPGRYGLKVEGTNADWYVQVEEY
jgi:hypothetical protein